MESQWTPSTSMIVTSGELGRSQPLSRRVHGTGPFDRGGRPVLGSSEPVDMCSRAPFARGAGLPTLRGLASSTAFARANGPRLDPGSGSVRKASRPKTASVLAIERGERPDSNRRPPGPQPGALPTELRSPRGTNLAARSGVTGSFRIRGAHPLGPRQYERVFGYRPRDGPVRFLRLANGEVDPPRRARVGGVRQVPRRDRGRRPRSAARPGLADPGAPDVARPLRAETPRACSPAARPVLDDACGSTAADPAALTDRAACCSRSSD